MADKTTTLWTVSVSKETNATARSFLAQRGLNTGDLSKFIEEAVRWRMVDQTVAEARGKFADLSSEELVTMIGDAVAEARTGKALKAK